MSKVVARPSDAPRVSRTGPQEGYRAGVGLLLINPARRVFLGERLGPSRDAWQMPQGGIDPGESPRAAARRELLEEVGTDRARLLAESRYWYAYDLPPELMPAHWGGRYRGQSQRWFAFRFTGSDADIDLERHHPEFARWRWASPAEALGLIVAFKRPVYQAVFQEFQRLIGT